MDSDGFLEADFERCDNGMVAAKFWSRKWLPIAVAGQSYILIDFDPGPNGLMGQVLSVYLQVETIQVVSESIHEFFYTLSEKAKMGKIIPSGFGGCFVCLDGWI